jgi:hypothetical protein
MLGLVEILVVDVQWEPGVIIVGSNLRTRTGGFTGSKIKKADLIPMY